MKFIQICLRSVCVSALLLSAWNPPVLAENVKIRVSDPNRVAEIVARGGRVIADYGSFKLLEADTTIAESHRGRHGVDIRDDDKRILLNAGTLHTTTPEATAARASAGAFAGKRLHLIQFAGPVHPTWFEALSKTGAAVVTHVPSNAYLVYGDAASLARLQAMKLPVGVVQWDSAYSGAYKVHPNARAPVTDDLYAIQLVADTAMNPTTIQMIDRLKLTPVRKQRQFQNYVNLIVHLPAGRIDEIAAQPDVVSIHRYAMPKKRDERQGQIVAGNVTGNGPTGPGYLDWLLSKGFTQAQFTASGFAVDVTDSGVDNATALPNHPGLYESGFAPGASRVIYSRLQGTPNAGTTLQGCDGHGTINAHIIGGYNNLTGFPHADSSGFRYGLGIAPFVKLGSSVIFDPNTYTFPDFEDLQSRAYNDGARISSNSWGASTFGSYNLDSQRYDALVRDAQPTGSTFPATGNQQMVIVFAAGNDGPGVGSVGAPGTAKNVITVGASENNHSHATANGGNNTAGNDGCNTPDSEANNLNDIIGFSSRGPTDDLRIKPDLVAPGTHITGGVAQAVSPGTNGTALSCFVASGVCGLPGGGTAGDPDNFFPAGQQFYTTSSGTSHSTPAVAGGAALVRQYFINQSSTPPTPAMTKAYLMNSARYLTGVSANDTLYSNNQGMGLMDLGFAFDGTARILRDELASDLFTATGQTRTISGTISDPGKPFRVTLAWTDAPGSTVGNAFRNDLDLTVTVNGNTYRGNVFSGAGSIIGGAADTRNNVESVYLPAGTTGAFTITVTAANINSDGVPGNATALDQDFALVVYNATATAGLPTLSIGNVSVTEGNTGTVNSVFTVTLSASSTQTVTVNYATADSSATSGSDYVTTSGTLTFNPGDLSKTVTVVVNGDTVAEPDETFFVNLTTPANATIAVSQGVGTIVNDDAATLPTLTINNVSVTEGNTGITNAVFTVTLSASSTQTVTVQYATANSTATAGSDYQATSGTLTFNPGDLSKTITVRVAGNTVVEPDETFFVNLTTPVNATIVVSQGVGTIINDDGVVSPTLSIGNVSVTEGNSGTVNAVFTVTLSASSTQTVTVNYATADSTATAGSDYVTTSGALTFNPGDLSKTVTVVVNGDTVVESNETFFVNLTTPTNATIATSQGVGTIVNDDGAALPTLSIGNVSVTEGNSGTVNAVFTVTLSASSTQTVTVNYATADSTATAGSDYVTTSGTLTFNPGDLSKTVTVVVNGDTVVEPDETFFVNLTTPANATLAVSQGVGTITNDDAVALLPTLSINNVSVTEGNTGSVNAVFTVTLSASSTQTVTVNYATASGTATGNTDYQTLSGTLTFSPGDLSKTITVRVKGDTVVEPNETYFVNLTAPANATLATSQGVGTILNDD